MSKHPYILLPPEDSPVYKPLIYIRLGYKKTHKIIPGLLSALIDSGADSCFCKKYIGEWLGIKFKKSKSFTYIAVNKTTFSALKETITLYFNDQSYECPFYFADDLPDEFPIILGQKGFFDHFKITFDLKNKEMEVV